MSENQDHACCAPARESAAPAEPQPVAANPGKHSIEQCLIPAQTFAMGDHHGDGKHDDGEFPVHPVSVSAFSIDATTVTNADWAEFAEDTGYRSEAETFGFSAVFHLAFAGEESDIIGQPLATPWWLGVKGADWAHPQGRHSGIDDLLDHPVTHISWNDAAAYCTWAGRRLPTEAEWECASRGGLSGQRFPWGNEEKPDGEWLCNIWQGVFPGQNTIEDGWLTTAPVRTYQPNKYGLWQSVGNVWEWCEDWFHPAYYAFCLTDEPIENPRGLERGSQKCMRGGSFLCHPSYCNRYRNAARSSNTPDSSMANTGFRTVALSEEAV
ncbi:formylglycine-generating enzyme family protein [Kineosporia babensis]|uniref:Formylglycine-generating enzyme family protein n=1 Tax=Kineosporia babensis TaxID=499548 RepID=A0A9X1N8B2_9ACTN|nr:formylglycine-generating enzyme family protein [Kineosporia babensis]MCD5309380.1 formylglycine-generating enzyme family protein [Kineosporia babensis]